MELIMSLPPPDPQYQTWAPSGPPPPAPAPPFRMSTGTKLIFAALGVAVLIAVGITATKSKDDAASQRSTSTQTVRYKLYGTARSADITMETPSGSTQKEVQVGATASAVGVFEFAPGDFLYISAQNNGDGELSCIIEIDGRVVATNTATGEFSIVTCKG